MNKRVNFDNIDYSNYNGYELVAPLYGYEPLFYKSSGGYSGDWFLMGYDEDNYICFKGTYGSCSGCDYYLSAFSHGGPSNNKENIQKFKEAHKPFWTRDRETIEGLDRDTLLSVLPRNRVNIDVDNLYEKIQENS